MFLYFILFYFIILLFYYLLYSEAQARYRIVPRTCATDYISAFTYKIIHTYTFNLIELYSFHILLRDVERTII